MATSNLSLTLQLAIIACLVVCTHSQASPAPTSTFRTLSLGTSISDIFYDYNSNPVPISAGSSALSVPYKATVGEPIELYQLIPPPPGSSAAPKRESLASFTLEQEGPHLVLMHYRPGTKPALKIESLTDTWLEHPVGTIRVFNFSKRTAMVKVGDQVVTLSPGQSTVFNTTSQTQVWLQAAVNENSQWTLRASSPQLTLPNSRSTAVLIDKEPSIELPNTNELLIRNYIERQRTPPDSIRSEM